MTPNASRHRTVRDTLTARSSRTSALVRAGRARLMATYVATSFRSGISARTASKLVAHGSEDRRVGRRDDRDPLCPVRSRGGRELGDAVERGIGAAEHHLVDAVDVRQPRRLAVFGRLLCEFPDLELAEARDGEHAVAVWKQLGHASLRGGSLR